MAIYSIYRFTNLVNSKVYIGKTTKDPEKRKAEHIKDADAGSHFKFHNALRKYGVDQFLFEVIDITGVDHNHLNELERFYIAEHRSCILDDNNAGYNMTRGGDGGRTLTTEQARENNLRRISVGDHPFIGEHGSKMATQRELRKVAEGRHPWAGERGREHMQQRTLEGTNPWAGELGSAHSKRTSSKRLAEGTHNLKRGSAHFEEKFAAGDLQFQKKHTCPHCGFEGKGNGMFRHHFDRCKQKSL